MLIFTIFWVISENQKRTFYFRHCKTHQYTVTRAECVVGVRQLCQLYYICAIRSSLLIIFLLLFQNYAQKSYRIATQKRHCNYILCTYYCTVTYKNKSCCAPNEQLRSENTRFAAADAWSLNVVTCLCYYYAGIMLATFARYYYIPA